MALRTPLYDWHVAHGARMVDFAGWDMPVQYTSIGAEHQAVRTGVGLFDISHMGRLTFEGPDALAFLQYLWTNDAAALKPGQVRYGLVCNEQGGILDDVLVYRLDAFWLMVVNASNREKILAWIDRHKGDRVVTVTDHTQDWGMVALQGPRAQALVGALRPEAVGLKYYAAGQYPALGGAPAASGGDVWSRTGYTGEDGWEVICAAWETPELVRRLTEGGGVTPCGLGARDTLRLEAAMPLYGHELAETTDPFQAGLAWAVKLDKGDFLGRDALAKRKDDPAQRVRVGLELDGKRIAREGAVVLAGGQAVGQVSSGTFGPTLQKSLAMAYVEPAFAAPGTAVEVDVRGKPATAVVVKLPFYKRK